MSIQRAWPLPVLVIDPWRRLAHLGEQLLAKLVEADQAEPQVWRHRVEVENALHRR